MPISVNWTSLLADFPRLRSSTTFKAASVATPRHLKNPIPYNCVAFALEKSIGWYWPHEDALWFDDLARDGSLDAMIDAFELHGYELCDDGNLQRGVQKIAIYLKAGEPTHVARQLGSGEWASKIGENIDARHTLDDLAGPCYGEAKVFMWRHRNAAHRRKRSRLKRRRD